MTDVEITDAEFLKSLPRTLTEKEVFAETARHDAYDLRPEERATGLDARTISDLVVTPRRDHTTALSG